MEESRADCRTFPSFTPTAATTWSTTGAIRRIFAEGWVTPGRTSRKVPFTAKQPVHDDRTQTVIGGRYLRTYGGTLIRRKTDWLILSAMSTPRNGGGTWGQIVMAAKKPEGPWSKPLLLLCPQSDVFHPPAVEFFPAFVNRQFVYAPATSVAANRTFQVIFRARLEEAHNPKAWSVYQLGSVWHSEAIPAEAAGIWGQTFSGGIAPTVIFASCSRPRQGQTSAQSASQDVPGFSPTVTVFGFRLPMRRLSPCFAAPTATSIWA